ncbi:MAG: tRNA (adenosine(37)-N6)-threonylcarbamoyltransferase complex dimerization subunit type 1 TsaB [Acidimicrobiales bacterium]
MGTAPPGVPGDTVNILAIESATDLAAVALQTADGSVTEVLGGEGRRHAEAIVPAIEEVCHRAGLSVRDVGLMAVDIGPGLFTGLRVGVATAKALAQALGIGVVGVRSLDILAATALAQGAGEVLAVVDARRGEVFAARYRRGPADPADPGAPPRRWAPAGLVDALMAEAPRPGGSGRPLVLVGDGAVRYRSLLGAVPDVELPGVDEPSTPAPSVLAAIARARIAAGVLPADAAAVLPEYLRDADAAINWEQRRSPALLPTSGGDGRA